VVKNNVEMGCESRNDKVNVVRAKMVNKKVVKVKVPKVNGGGEEVGASRVIGGTYPLSGMKGSSFFDRTEKSRATRESSQNT
jgi:hypothetical protein